MRVFAVLLLAALATCAIAQDAYRWVGKDGKVHYSDAPPPADAQKVEPKRLDASVVSGAEKYSYETRRAAADFPITLYVSADCGNPCESARKYLATRGIPYAEKRVESASDIAAFKQATQSDTMPTILVGKMVGKGFQEDGWSSLLHAAGYPAAK
jgi:glutaredoxin